MNRLDRFNRIDNYLIVIPILIIAAIYGFMVFASQVKPEGRDCRASLTTQDLDVGAPRLISVAAFADRQCIADILTEFGEAALPAALLAGYPSIALQSPYTERVLDTLSAMVRDSGDRYVFAADTEVAALLTSMHSKAPEATRESLEYLFDFALSTSPEAERRKFIPFDLARFVNFAPPAVLTESQIRPFCERPDCVISEDLHSLCLLADPAIKLAIKRDFEATWSLLHKCPISPEFIDDLRKKGFVDALCSSTSQVDASVKNGKVIGCSDIIQHISDYNITDQDIVLLLKNMNTLEPNNNISKTAIQKNKEKIQTLYPEIELDRWNSKQ